MPTLRTIKVEEKGMIKKPSQAIQIEQDLIKLQQKYEIQTNLNGIKPRFKVAANKPLYREFVKDCHVLAKKYKIGKYAATGPTLS